MSKPNWIKVAVGNIPLFLQGTEGASRYLARRKEWKSFKVWVSNIDENTYPYPRLRQFLEHGYTAEAAELAREVAVLSCIRITDPNFISIMDRIHDEAVLVKPIDIMAITTLQITGAKG